MEEQVRSSFGFSATQVAGVISQNMAAVQVNLALDSVILEQPSKELDSGRRAALPEVCGDTPRQVMHRLDQSIRGRRLEIPVHTREWRKPLVVMMCKCNCRKDSAQKSQFISRLRRESVHEPWLQATANHVRDGLFVRGALT